MLQAGASAFLSTALPAWLAHGRLAQAPAGVCVVFTSVAFGAQLSEPIPAWHCAVGFSPADAVGTTTNKSCHRSSARSSPCSGLGGSVLEALPSCSTAAPTGGVQGRKGLLEEVIQPSSWGRHSRARPSFTSRATGETNPTLNSCVAGGWTAKLLSSSRGWGQLGAAGYLCCSHRACKTLSHPSRAAVLQGLNSCWGADSTAAL